MSNYQEVKHSLPPNVQKTLENAKRLQTRESLHTFRYWLRRHERQVQELRTKVDARIDRRREVYYRRGLSPDHKGFITPDLSEHLELLYRLECGVAAAVEEYKALKAKVESHGP